MIKRRIINAVLEWLSKNKAIQREEYDKYSYIMEIVWIMTLPFIMMIPINFVTQITYEGFVLLISFSLLRRVCGGYHFAKEGTCYIVSFFFLIDIILVGKMISGKGIILALLVSSFVSICLISAILAKLSKGHKRILDVILLNLIIGIIELTFWLSGKDDAAKWLILGSVMTAILQYPLLINEIITLLHK